MPKPVCVKCQRFFRPIKNGAKILENKPKGTTAESLPGKEAPHMWEPYKIWMCDLWVCRGCGATIGVGFGNNPLWENHRGPLPEDEYFPVNDC